MRFQQSWQAALEAKEAQMEVVEKEGTGELIESVSPGLLPLGCSLLSVLDANHSTLLA